MDETQGFSEFDWPPPNPPIKLPEPPGEPVLLTVHVALDETDPPVWRRVTIPGELDLGRVHDALQQVMGWEESHLHRFGLTTERRPGPWFVTQFDRSEGEEGTLETEARLDQLLRVPGDTLTYEYDFGDGWRHTLTLESVDPMPDPADAAADGEAEAGSAAYPLVCLAGERACPPEDVGGVGGYEEMAEWVRSGYEDARLPRRGLTADELRDWLPEGWEPDRFDLDEVNAALARLAPRDTDTALAQLPPELAGIVRWLSTPARFELDEWLSAPGWAEPLAFTAEEAAALTRPVRVVLDVVGDGLALTAAGYLPPRAVEAIYRALGMGDEWIGKGNREDQTLPVLRLREQVARLGLIRKAKGQLLPTVVARKVRDDPSALLGHVLGRLLSGLTEFDRMATQFALIAVAGGQWSRHLALWGPVTEVVCRVLTIHGWARDPYGELERNDVSGAIADTVSFVGELVRAAAEEPREEPELAARVARAALAAMA